MQVYAPDVLVVAISWTLFWMDKHVSKVFILSLYILFLEIFILLVFIFVNFNIYTKSTK